MDVGGGHAELVRERRRFLQDPQGRGSITLTVAAE